MDTIKSVLFENPLPLYIALVPVEIVLLVVWRMRRTRRTLCMLALPTVIAAIVSLTAWLVPTDRKYIAAAGREIAAGLERGNTDPLAKYLDERFSGTVQGSPVTKATAIQLAKSIRNSNSITRIIVAKTQVQVSGDRATMTATTMMKISDVLAGTGYIQVIFDITWARTAGGWRIVESKEPALQLAPAAPPGEQ